MFSHVSHHAVLPTIVRYGVAMDGYDVRCARCTCRDAGRKVFLFLPVVDGRAHNVLQKCLRTVWAERGLCGTSGTG